MSPIKNLGQIKGPQIKAMNKARRAAQEAAEEAKKSLEEAAEKARQEAAEKARQEAAETQMREITGRVARQIMGPARILDVFNVECPFNAQRVVQLYKGALTTSNSQWAPWSKNFTV